jgi:shikimate 5-dehydrogenase
MRKDRGLGGIITEACDREDTVNQGKTNFTRKLYRWRSIMTDKPDRYAVIGHPVQHSRSPVIHSLFAKQTGQNLIYELIDASPEDFETAVRGFGAAGGKGLNITVPHKHSAAELCDELGAEAERAGAVNTITFVTRTR